MCVLFIYRNTFGIDVKLDVGAIDNKVLAINLQRLLLKIDRAFIDVNTFIDAVGARIQMFDLKSRVGAIGGVLKLGGSDLAAE